MLYKQRTIQFKDVSSLKTLLLHNIKKCIFLITFTTILTTTTKIKKKSNYTRYKNQNANPSINFYSTIFPLLPVHTTAP